mmetsp:Transcript_115562/g.326688  ORF Transcript_115562/g.326688 Transcript_115562/m.326688 type:complete len:392 (-) Transcript_115562:346-1521(-)
MVAWAGSTKFKNTGFLCICVDPNAQATANEFGQLYFTSAPDSLINGFIESQSDFPNFQAQLGCQGFIIYNAARQLFATKTLPFMQYREHAFRDVEGKLFQLLQPPPPSNPLNAPLGQCVRIVNLASESGKALNGQVGEVVGSTESGRFLVKVGDASKAMRPENLEDATDAPVGKRLQVVGLTSEKGQKLNGQVGEVLGGTKSGRYIVRLSDTTMSLKKENLQDPKDDDVNVTQYLSGVASVGHDMMDAQHNTCIRALEALWQDLTVKSLKRAREELQAHFSDEEMLLQESRFGQTADLNPDSNKATNDFSAFASHTADHKRIIALADEALSSLRNVCEASDAHGGTVPKQVVASLCKAFAEHAEMYDALYEGKIDAPRPTASALEQMDTVE